MIDNKPSQNKQDDDTEEAIDNSIEAFQTSQKDRRQDNSIEPDTSQDFIQIDTPGGYSFRLASRYLNVYQLADLVFLIREKLNGESGDKKPEGFGVG